MKSDGDIVMKAKLQSKLASVAISVIVLAACSTTGSNSERTVPESKRHELLDGGPYKAVWTARELTLNYEYVREPARLLLSGSVRFPRGKKLISFVLGAHLIDAEGKIIHEEAIASAGTRQRVEQIAIDSEVKIPAETWGIAFSYEGSSGGGGQSGSPRSFWQTPF